VARAKAVKTSGMKLFGGNANTKLASEIAGQLSMNLGKITVSRFADGEVNVMVHENVRGKDVYIIQVRRLGGDDDDEEEEEEKEEEDDYIIQVSEHQRGFFWTVLIHSLADSVG
jgi:phosphoribosylpyrophosphate synthetase